MNLSEVQARWPGQAGLMIITIRLGEAEGEAHDVDSLLPGASIGRIICVDNLNKETIYFKL